jgi:hypothetical protein
MIKFTGSSDDGRVLVGLGLSEGNLQMMRKGNPIHIFGAEMNSPVDIIIFWGATDQALAEAMKPYIGPETVISDLLTNPPKKS